MGAGGLFVALGWIINSYATSLPNSVSRRRLSGLGAGAVYCTAVGTAVKWFTDHRGLAVGLVAGGFGAGAALTIIPIQMAIKTGGYASAFFWAGLLQGAVVLVVSQFIRNPNRGEVAAQVSTKAQQTTYSYSPHEVLTSLVFWVLYVLDVLMCAGGLDRHCLSGAHRRFLSRL